MELNDVLGALQYRDSPNFLTGKALDSDRDFGHIFRKAGAECGLLGAYVLNGAANEKPGSNVPIVYVCKAASEAEAREIHRKVWNQNSVPFLVVVTQGLIRLYPGFRYTRETGGDPEQGALKVLTDFNEIAVQLKAIQATSIDNGDVWRDLGDAVTPEKRVDWRLLENLRQLDEWLHSEGVTDRRLAHSLIGKFVYFRYLRERKILSDQRLEKWQIAPGDVFSHTAKLSAFIKLVQHVDEWLNGSVFPLPISKIESVGEERLRKIASVFHGEQAGSGQLPLFDVYDFSFIPIETLSVIYEQFLHATMHTSGQSVGEEQAAYYTPVPVVNYMLDRLDSRKPFKPGMRVLDASCGSGAFLVQCYRKLVERRRQELGRRLRPSELGNLLTQSIYGVDIDADACQIAELSLALTLLDYVNPPDLTETPWKLPALRDRNIYHANAFDDNASWYVAGRERPFQWIVGNPPWKDLKPARLAEGNVAAWQWMEANKKDRPVGGNQLAEAFAWRVGEVLDTDGVAALLIPAMTLFKYESVGFRKAFLEEYQLWAVANFANLVNSLFAGRATLPATALFFCSSTESSRVGYSIETYSPMLATQPASRAGRHQTIWNIVVNAGDLQEVEARDVVNGQFLPWKIAMWGSSIDSRVLRITEKRHKTLGQLEDDGVLVVSQGLELRSNDDAKEVTERHDELAGKLTLDVESLKNRRFLFRFPQIARILVDKERTAVRTRGGFERPMKVNEPPHVVVGASRSYAVYTEEFLVVPARQIGVSSPTSQSGLLKALALYLNSDFVAYHQFLTAPEAGIQKTRHTLSALRCLPVPFHSGSDFGDWQRLYAKIERHCADRDDFDEPELAVELNEIVFDALKMSSRERAAVHDLVHVRFGMTRGKVSPVAVRPPSTDELHHYGAMLRDELDAFVRQSSATRHKVDVMTGRGSGMVMVELIEDHARQIAVGVLQASDATAQRMIEAQTKLVERRSQWLYFNRNLRVYDGPRIYMLKPLQRLHWTRTQAMEDAREMIAESLQPDPQTVAGGALA